MMGYLMSRSMDVQHDVENLKPWNILMCTKKELWLSISNAKSHVYIQFKIGPEALFVKGLNNIDKGLDN